MKDKPIIALDIEIPEIKNLPSETQKYFGICQEKLGLIPNVLQAYTHEIDQFNAFSQIYSAIMFADTGLEPLEREMIAVVVSSKNHCFYCLSCLAAVVLFVTTCLTCLSYLAAVVKRPGSSAHCLRSLPRLRALKKPRIRACDRIGR